MGCGRGGNEVSPSKSKGCVCEVVRAVLEIQNRATNDDCSSCTTNCFLEPLGGIVSPARTSADTRVFTLLTKFGTPFMASFSPVVDNHNHNSKNRNNDCDDICTSIYFRVEDVFDGCCATLRVLQPLDNDGDPVDLLNEDGTAISMRAICGVTDFAATDSCVTVDLDCFCAVQCIADVNLGICN
ncbi:CotY/CotZ family spore coat protein [Solibacillus sp. FSL H8-0538]|uniref:CotY/CotZ family spore coat protein n=1 Tax=Solibacillus sp. FSL H8-0538 TaxID=2921400 RepID=UPI0030FAB258